MSKKKGGGGLRILRLISRPLYWNMSHNKHKKRARTQMAFALQDRDLPRETGVKSLLQPALCHHGGTGSNSPIMPLTY